MPHLILKYNGIPAIILHDTTLAELPDHIARGFPEFAADYADGLITGEEVEDVSGVVVVQADGKDAVRDAYVAAKAAITTMAQNAAIPADARQAVVTLGLCVEALLRYLNKRIA